MTPAERFDENVRLAYWTRNRFCHAWNKNRDDYTSSCLYGLWLACLRYQERDDAKFSTYAVETIRYTMMTDEKQSRPMQVGRGRRHIRILTGMDFADIPSNGPEERRPDEDLKRIVRTALKKNLHKKQLEAVLSRFEDGLTLEQSGRRMKITRSRVRQIVAGAMLRLEDSVVLRSLFEGSSEDRSRNSARPVRRKAAQDTLPSWDNLVREYEDAMGDVI